MVELKKSRLNYNLLSMHRSKLMGLAMLLVVFFHSTINFDYLSNYCVIHKICLGIKDIGNCGVDIFLFVSGIGMYFSWNKTKDAFEFYKKRLIRIVPTYLPIIFILSLILYKLRKIDFLTFVLDVTVTRFWFRKGYLSWYISAILLLYLMVPIFMKSYQKYKNKAFIMYLIGIALLNVVCQNPYLWCFRIFVARMPIFFIGIKFGEMCYEKREITNKHIILGLISLILGLMILAYFYIVLVYDNRFYSIEKYSYILIILPMSIILSYLFERAKEFCRFEFLTFIGTLTLEIYSVHERLLLQLLNDSILFNMFYNYKIIYNVVIFILTIIISVAFNKFIKVFRSIQVKRMLEA